MQFLAGYKTYIVAAFAVLYAWIGYFMGAPPPSMIPPESLADAIKITLAAAAVFGLRSGMANEIKVLLAGVGIQVPATSSVAVKMASAADQAKSIAPVLALFFVLTVGGFLQGCATAGGGGLTPQQTLQAVEAGFAIAEATYDTICSINAPPSFCTDPRAEADYAAAKQAFQAAFNTAQAALTASNGLDSAAIEQLLQAVSQDWTTYSNIVNGLQAKNAAMLGIRLRH